MSLTIGQRLRKAREERYIKLEKVSAETRIRIAFIKALEEDDYSSMPSAAQGRGFLRNYAEYLNINIDEVIAELQRNAPPPGEISGPLPQVNLVETEIPALTESAEEQKPPSFWTSWFLRRQKTDTVSEADSSGSPDEAASVQSPAIEHPSSRDQSEITHHDVRQETVNEVRTEEDTLTVEAGQAEGLDEAKPTLFARLRSLFHIRMAGQYTASEIEEMPEPVIETRSIPAAPSESAAQIFAEIGRKLRERRELISLTIDEVERHTRMRAALVRALEEGALDKLPSPVQTRGMLANYAAFLDLDADTILLRFADALQSRHRERYSSTPREKIETKVATSMPILRSFIAGDLVFGMVMLILILALGVWGIGRVLNSQADESAQATAPSIVEVLAGTSQPTPTLDVTFIPVDEAPVATGASGLNTIEAPTLGANINVVINVFAVERTFVRISVDGEVAFEGRIAPRETQVYEAENQVEVLTGNGAALRITYNGRDLGLMGDVGEVVSRVYTIAGIVTPTATIPPTATETPLVTITSTATQTATPTLENTVTPSGN